MDVRMLIPRRVEASGPRSWNWYLSQREGQRQAALGNVSVVQRADIVSPIYGEVDTTLQKCKPICKLDFA